MRMLDISGYMYTATSNSLFIGNENHFQRLDDSVYFALGIVRYESEYLQKE